LTTVILILAALQIVTLVVLFLLLRKTSAPVQDPRLNQLADTLPSQLTRLDARFEGLDHHVRSELTQLRADAAAEAHRTRESAAADFSNLRGEITRTIAELSNLLQTSLNAFSADNKTSDETLRTAVQQNLDSIAQRLTYFIGEVNRSLIEAREALHTRLNEISGETSSQQEKLRFTVEDRLTKLNEDNAAKLEEMRVTVDEKLHATLQTRLTESFGAVSDQLIKVHTGLGEMTLLTSGVNDLNRMFSNVKSRGGIAEVMLGSLLAQTLAPSQYLHNAQVKPGTQEVVEYAVRFPGTTGETLLPIDAKFPREDWERLESALESGVQEDIASTGKAFETAIRTQAKLISNKYINEPITTPHAIMFLPTENLFAEIVRRDGLQADLQRNYHVTIAGPSTLSCILISFQMGFHMLNLQKKGDEVWKVLASTRTEFDKFGDLMTSMEKQVGTVQNTIQKLGVRTRAINRTLRDVSETDTSPGNVLGFDGVAPLLAASGEDD
jgi:DNA recombination protein RmuC